MLQPGTVVHDRWHIECRLGEGGESSVYLARDVLLGSRVALKETRLELPDERRRRAISHFAAEARLLAGLDHPGIVRVLDYLDCDTRQYLVMEHIEGRSLQALLDEATGPLPLGPLLAWAETLCETLAWLHNHQPRIVFRDLKPANVMLDLQGQVRLIDFGIARLCEPDVATASYIKNAGTPGFAPIEQYSGESNDPRSDIYAMGAMLYALLTGQVPPISVARLAGDADLLPLNTWRDDVPMAVSTLVFDMLAVRKADRPASIEIVLKRLKNRDNLQAFSGTAALPTPIAPACDCTADTRCMAHQLPFSGPFTVLYRGTRDAAGTVLAHTRRAGLPAHLLYGHDPTAAPRGAWMVVMAHALSRS